MSSIIKVIFLMSLCSFITNCSLWSKSEEEKEAEIARYKDYYPSDVYTDIAEEGGDDSRSTASYEDDDYSAADEDPADNQDDEQNAYLDKSLDEDNSEAQLDVGGEELPVEKSIQASAPQATAAATWPKKFKNKMHKFSKKCNMRLSADKGAGSAGKVSNKRKLWVENHNANWVKVQRKAGPAYIHKSCL